MHVGAPSAPSNLAVNLLVTEENEVIILLAWSQDNSQCVVVYHVEVTSTNSVNNMDTTSQHITLTLQIGVEYSFPLWAPVHYFDVLYMYTCIMQL